MKVDFARERTWWNAKAPTEELDSADEAINRALRWREIERHLEGIETILDVGAGTGAFSIPLAQRGYQVTHFDISPIMLEIARRKAGGLANIHFVEGNAVDLYRFANRSFDLVLNMDGAISFCGQDAEQSLRESCRVTGKRLIVTVSNRAQLVPVVASASLEETDCLTSPVYVIFDRGEWHREQFPENAQLTKRLAQDYLGPIKAFLAAELRAILEDADLEISRVGGLGSLASLCTREAIESVLKNETVFDEFITLCERFDLETLPDGPGPRQRAGLIAVAKRP